MRLSILSTLIIAVTTAAALPAASDNKGNSGAPLENHPGIPGVKRQENDSPDGCPEPFRACPGVKRDQNDYPPSGKPCNDSSDCEETLEFCNPSMGKCVTKPHFGGS